VVFVVMAGVDLCVARKRHFGKVDDNRILPFPLHGRPPLSIQ
jgi:hypothetical protein